MMMTKTDSSPQLSKVVDLSVIIVNWNTLDMLRDALSSVFASPTDDLEFEVIVIDNASEDGSADMVEKKFPAVYLIRNGDNRGFAAANNQGFKVATGRFILMLNSDTIVLGDVLAKSVRYLDHASKQNIGAMGCRVLNKDRTTQLTCSMYPSTLNLFLLASGLWKKKGFKFLGRYQMLDWGRVSERRVEVISGCYMIIRREAFERVGELDENFFFFGEETDWCRRARDAGWILRFAPVGEIIHYGSVSAKKLSYRRDVLLTRAFVKLHRKHDGILSASLVWLILFGFNFSRFLFWSLKGLYQPSARPRALHFFKVSWSQVRGH